MHRSRARADGGRWARPRGDYRERGLEVPDRRRATKIAVDAILAPALDPEPYAESIGFSVGQVVDAGRLDPDHREQLAPLLAASEALDRALETDGQARAEADRLLTAARELLAGGGLNP